MSQNMGPIKSDKIKRLGNARKIPINNCTKSHLLWFGLATK